MAYSASGLRCMIPSVGGGPALWIYTGAMRPETGYPTCGIIEQGFYTDNRKDGVWTEYYEDGVTPKLKGESIKFNLEVISLVDKNLERFVLSDAINQLFCSSMELNNRLTGIL